MYKSGRVPHGSQKLAAGGISKRIAVETTMLSSGAPEDPGGDLSGRVAVAAWDPTAQTLSNRSSQTYEAVTSTISSEYLIRSIERCSTC